MPVYAQHATRPIFLVIYSFAENLFNLICFINRIFKPYLLANNQKLASAVKLLQTLKASLAALTAKFTSSDTQSGTLPSSLFVPLSFT